MKDFISSKYVHKNICKPQDKEAFRKIQQCVEDKNDKNTREII